MPYDVQQLLSMSQKELDALFTQATQARSPRARRKAPRSSRRVPYSAEKSPGSSSFRVAREGVRSKVGLLLNRIGPFGLNAIIAKVYKAPSWLDNKECIVLDYSETSIVAHGYETRSA